MTGPRGQAVEILLQRIDPALPVPSYAHPGDAGADLVTAIDIDLGPGERLLVPTGIAIALPAGYAAFVHPRSGLAARFGLSIVNAPGTIDAGFRGEIKVLVINHDPVQRVQLQRGHRIAQLVVQRVEHVHFLEVASLPGSARGEGGYGSTGGFLEPAPLQAPTPQPAAPQPAAAQPAAAQPAAAQPAAAQAAPAPPRRRSATARPARHTAPQAPPDMAALADTPIRRAGRREVGARKSPVPDGRAEREPILESTRRAEPPPVEPVVERPPAEPVIAPPVPPERSENSPGEANMSMFRRGNTDKKPAAKRASEPESSSPRGRKVTADAGSRASQPPADVRQAPGGRPTRDGGPWDISEIPDPGEDGRVDLGGLWLPAFEGLEIRVEADPQTGSIVSVTLVLDDSALQVQPFAAPRTGGIWDEVRTEMAAGLTQQGGTADMVEGPFGTELRARVPVTRNDGTSGVEAARFIGVDGPRWFLRGALTGRAAAQPGDYEPLLDVFREIVVVRGSTPMAPREPIPLMLPQAVQDAGPEAEETLEPFERGPEITEIR